MIIHVPFNNKNYRVDLSKPQDISLPIKDGNENPTCYWAEPVTMEIIRMGDFIGSVEQGGTVNYQKLSLTPHGNGTHTECYGHISSDGATINQCLAEFHFLTELISIAPDWRDSGDWVITRKSVQEKLKHPSAQAVIIRTLPNLDIKKTANYSGANPPYLDHETAAYLVELGVHHLLIDLPSIDRESDGGKLLAHKAFWQFPRHTRKDCTITELVYVDDTIKDGLYFLNLQIINLEMDASPSKPVLYNLTEVL